MKRRAVLVLILLTQTGKLVDKDCLQTEFPLCFWNYCVCFSVGNIVAELLQ